MSISNHFPLGRAHAATALGLLFSVMSLPAWADGNPITQLQAQVAALQQTVGAQAQQITGLSQSVTMLSQAVTALSKTVNTQTTQIAALNAYVNPLQGVLTFNSASSTVQFKGVNVQIVNGTGHTAFIDANATGNLIIGYNEDNAFARGSCTVSTRGNVDSFESLCLSDGGTFTRLLSGSHNLVIGVGHGYSSTGGMVVGLNNLISGLGAVVSGGEENTASGLDSSVSGGASNAATGQFSSVSGGSGNSATGFESSVSGGSNLSDGNDAGWAAGGTGTPTFSSP